ncbi:hypothetical protein [Tardiphaga sp. 367_B4_N1_1]|uniref:hypothetical protein n=1 Tax=Tardiphaga sp. 367_B4_N1_1 TaxID=3240777 RepID=UPI003F23F71C
MLQITPQTNGNPPIFASADVPLTLDRTWGLSPALSDLMEIWRARRDVAVTLSDAADQREHEDKQLDQALDMADAAESAVQNAIAHHLAHSFADVLAKFETVRDLVQSDDIAARMKDENDVVLRMLWSIGADLLSLSTSSPMSE